MVVRRRRSGSSHKKIDDDEILIISNTPNPYPPRGIYGFVLFLVTWAVFVAFLAWAFVPKPTLDSFYITYVPSKFWAVLGPALIPILTAIFVVFHCIWNACQFRGLFENVSAVDNDFMD